MESSLQGAEEPEQVPASREADHPGLGARQGDEGLDLFKIFIYQEYFDLEETPQFQLIHLIFYHHRQPVEK